MTDKITLIKAYRQFTGCDLGQAKQAVEHAMMHQEIKTLRDEFAGQAMAGFCADPTNHKLFDDMADMAQNAYEVADAMIKARIK